MYTLCTPYSVHNISRKFETNFMDLFYKPLFISYYFFFQIEDLGERKQSFVWRLPRNAHHCAQSSIFSWFSANFRTYFVVAMIPKIVTFNCQENRILNYWKLKLMMMIDNGDILGTVNCDSDEEKNSFRYYQFLLYKLFRNV